VITSISVHHDASFRPHDYDSVARYHAEAAEHYTRLGPGLQYHYKIDNTGVIFKIRPHEVWTYTVGTAENVTCLAICLDGNFENQEPTKEQFEALYQLIKNLCTEHPEFPATWPDVRSHNDYSSTACCGANLRGHILPIQDEASAQAQLLNQGTYDWPEYQPGEPKPKPKDPAPIPPTPAPTPVPTIPDTPPEPKPKDQTDVINETNGIVKQILAIIKQIAVWLHITKE
jgi:cell division protein FtsN